MDLFDLTDSLRRAVAAPGEFDTTFPNTSDDDLAGTLADALAEAQLDGFLSQVALDWDAMSTDGELTSSQRALIVLYARARVITSRLANLRNRTRYVAGNVEAENETSASILVEILRDTAARKKAILEDARWGSGGVGFAMVDLYVTRSLDYTGPDVGHLNALGR